MNDSVMDLFNQLLLATLRLSLPLMFAAMGGYFSERSGVAQIALEAFLLVGAFSAATTAFFTKSVLLSYLAAALLAVFVSQIFSLLVLRFKANSIVTGTALNLLVIGAIPIISKQIFNSTGSTPTTELDPALATYFPYLLFITVLIFSYTLSEKTNWGLQFKFAGEKKLALESAGISYVTRQWQAVSLCALITGLGGAMLSTSLSSNYSPLMSAGRGYIALAALIFSGWRLKKTILVCLIFGFCEALQIIFQSNETLNKLFAAEFIQSFPYLITLLALVLVKVKQQAPAEIA